MTLESQYLQNPWSRVANKTREFYIPELQRMYMGSAIYGQFVGMEFQLAGLGTESLVTTELLMPNPNNDEIGLRDVGGDTSHMDSRKRAIGLKRYFGKLSFHKYDNYITLWKADGVQGLNRIVNLGLGYHATWVREKLARNAHLNNPYALYGTTTSGATGFNDITSGDTMTSDRIRAIALGMKERSAPYAMYANTYFPGMGDVFCITTPGVVFDLMQEAEDKDGSTKFVNVMQYADPTRVANGEIGSWLGVRFIETNLACLYNCGAIDTQTTVTAAISAGDGAPDPATTAVDQVYYVGESTATHYITVADSSDFAVGDYVTVHVDRTNDFGVTNGVDYRDGKIHNRRIVSKPSGTRLTFDQPIMEDFSTDLGGTVFGYVTKGRHIHTATFVRLGQPSVVNGILQPPMVYSPNPNDETNSMFRFTWDSYERFQIYTPEAAEVLYITGPNRMKGDLVRT